MKNTVTELVFILDRSGSMAGLEMDTIGGFNSMLKKQKSQEGTCYVTTMLFDNEFRLLHDRIDIRGIKEMSEEEYQVGGSTALLDAMGMCIRKIENVQRNTLQEYKSDNVMFVIITDGEENSSRDYNIKDIRQMIEYQKSKNAWEFIFLGANIDAVETARMYGISKDRAQNFHPDGQGVTLNFEAISDAISHYRCASVMPDTWNEEISKDYKKRK
ncbi:VWA domain-containing protein [Erysipelothrix sp. HDW6A]|uniref:vWA domain-containing protein n=1 Tax=Erysipelothrix sp. HDW6A TaxID=2714928 RepID=UPI00140B5BBA|nr:vWA domain-containing protein [Erysipelothrix sp. HDW6A]QIK57910.1 VWA domain-containing protein [Erysipelothrix sp. HDW6A]